MQFYGDESFYHAVVVGPSRKGWFVAFAGFEAEGLQDTKIADILAAPPRSLGKTWIWSECEARFYTDNVYYPAYCGPETDSGGHLVAFVGFEAEPLQDTDPADIRTAYSSAAVERTMRSR